MTPMLQSHPQWCANTNVGWDVTTHGKFVSMADRHINIESRPLSESESGGSGSSRHGRQKVGQFRTFHFIKKKERRSIRNATSRQHRHRLQREARNQWIILSFGKRPSFKPHGR